MVDEIKPNDTVAPALTDEAIEKLATAILSHKEFGNKLNSTVSSHIKRTTNKVPAAAKETVDESEVIESSETPAVSKKAHDKQNSRLAELEAVIAKQKSKAQKQTFQLAVNQSIKGKINEDWQEEFVSKIAPLAVYGDEDDVGIKFGEDEVLSVNEAVSKLLAKPEYKKFLPAPKTSLIKNTAKFTPIAVDPSKPKTPNERNALISDLRSKINQ